MGNRFWALLRPSQAPAGSMPAADVLIIDENPYGIFLYGYTFGGEFAGDTWHRTVADAKNQAVFEHGDRLQPWQEIPESVADPIAFALIASRRSN